MGGGQSGQGRSILLGACKKEHFTPWCGGFFFAPKTLLQVLEAVVFSLLDLAVMPIAKFKEEGDSAAQ